MFLFKWRLLAGAIRVVVARVVRTQFYINPIGYLITFTTATLFWRFGLSATRSNSQASYCLVAMAQILVAVSILTTWTYLATLPAWDTTLLAWDRALGFDSRSYLQFISTLIPVIGVYDTLGLKASDFPYFQPLGYYDTLREALLLRSGSLHGLTLSRAVGLVTFPSFHAVSAVLYMWAFWPLTLIRPLTVPWNIAMIAATPLGGGHYFVNVLAGILAAVLVIFTALAISNHLSSAPVADGACRDHLNACLLRPRPKV